MFRHIPARLNLGSSKTSEPLEPTPDDKCFSVDADAPWRRWVWLKVKELVTQPPCVFGSKYLGSLVEPHPDDPSKAHTVCSCVFFGDCLILAARIGPSPDEGHQDSDGSEALGAWRLGSFIVPAAPSLAPCVFFGATIWRRNLSPSSQDLLTVPRRIHQDQGSIPAERLIHLAGNNGMSCVVELCSRLWSLSIPSRVWLRSAIDSFGQALKRGVGWGRQT